MSYDIRLKDETTGQTLEADEIHGVNGGTMAIGGTSDLWLNVTYNYAKIFRRVLPEKGIRTIYGMTGAESVPVLEAAIAQLGDDVHSDYWAATEGNAKAALMGLLKFAQNETGRGLGWRLTLPAPPRGPDEGAQDRADCRGL